MSSTFRVATLQQVLAIATILVVASVSSLLYGLWNRRARSSFGQRPAPGVPSFRYLYKYIQASTFASSLGVCLIDSPWLLPFDRPTWLIIGGYAVVLTGLILFFLAMRYLGSAYSPCYEPNLPVAIVTKGPYRFIRHPIYTANVGIMLGLLVVTGTGWIAFNVLLLVPCYLVAVSREQRALSESHPSYTAYLESTGAFLPKLRRNPTDVQD